MACEVSSQLHHAMLGRGGAWTHKITPNLLFLSLSPFLIMHSPGY